MSELKAIYATDKDSVTGLYYPKSEADKVIFEKDQQIDLYKRGWKESDRINAFLYKEQRHQKRKRCLAMAEYCKMTRRWFGQMLIYGRVDFYKKWYNKWLELADKFKDTK